MPKQTVPYLDGHLNANPYRAPCNGSHQGVGCKAYRMGISEVRFSQKRFNACKANHSGTARSEAWYGM